MAAQDPKYAELEKRLNADHTLRGEFVKDPTKILKQEGVQVSPEMERAVHSQIAGLKIPAQPPANFHFPHIHIHINISISAD